MLILKVQGIKESGNSKKLISEETMKLKNEDKSFDLIHHVISFKSFLTDKKCLFEKRSKLNMRIIRFRWNYWDLERFLENIATSSENPDQYWLKSSQRFVQKYWKDWIKVSQKIYSMITNISEN
jgi:hypothetical protein